MAWHAASVAALIFGLIGILFAWCALMPKGAALDRLAAWGMRLDVPSDGAVRFQPGATVTVSLVPIGGARIVQGFGGAVNGPLDERDPREALAGLVARGYLHVPASED